MLHHHHHHSRFDDFDHLKSELDQEKRYRESIEWANQELERSIAELEAYLGDMEANSKGADDNEWKVRFESQTALNKQLQDQKEWLETELSEARKKLTTGSYPEAMNFNLDALNEPELLRLVKHLERMRNDFYSTLRDTEWKLDKESKEFHHFDEMRRAYKSDLKHMNHSIERMRLTHVLDPSGVVSPLYPPGYFRWLDSHTPMPSRSYGTDDSVIGTGKSGTKSPHRRSSSHSPKKNKPQMKSEGTQSPTRTRSKSRGDKKLKKKDKEDATSDMGISKSETEQGNGSEGSGGDHDTNVGKNGTEHDTEAKDHEKPSTSKKRESTASKSRED